MSKRKRKTPQSPIERASGRGFQNRGNNSVSGQVGSQGPQQPAQPVAVPVQPVPPSDSQQSISPLSAVKTFAEEQWGKIVSWQKWSEIGQAVRWSQWPSFTKNPLLWIGVAVVLLLMGVTSLVHSITSLNWWWSIGIVWFVISYSLAWILLEIPRSTWKIINLSFVGVLIFLKLFIGSQWDWVIAAFVALAVPYIMSGEFIFTTVSRPNSVKIEKADWLNSWFKVMKQFPDAKWYHHFTVWLEYYWAVRYSYSPAGIHADTTWLAEILPGGFNPGGRTIPWDRVNELRYRGVGVILEWPPGGWLEVYASATASIFVFLVRNPKELLETLGQYRLKLVDD